MSDCTMAVKDRISADIGWTSNDPHLSGNFAPVGREIESSDLPVIAGRIPPDLCGAYIRNGPNPLFEPISFTYPMDGDGMIHAVYFDNGRARYKNRFVRTRGLAVERRTGRAVYGGLLRPTPVDPALVGADGEQGLFKNGAFINVLRHGHRLLALSEASPAYEMTMELDTIGEWQAGTGRPLSLGAHNRRHPATGALFALAYSAEEPVVHFHEIDPAGTLVRTFPVKLPAPAMIHDFVLTQQYIVLLVGPAVFDAEAAQEGRPFLQWRPELGTRIAVLPLDGRDAIWLETPAFFVFHFANGFERGRQIVIDYVRHERLSLGPGDRKKGPPTLCRMILDLPSRSVTNDDLTDVAVEFPRINDRLETMASRYVYVPMRSDTLTLPDQPSAVFNTILKVDTDAGRIERHDLGNRIAGEPVFIPKTDTDREDDGYLAVYAYDPASATSDLLLLDAARIDADPIAAIRLPQRVPQGLHGAWISK